jgi:hypothetical protein
MLSLNCKHVQPVKIYLHLYELLPSLGVRRPWLFKKSSPLKPLNQIKTNLAGMVPEWVPFKIVAAIFNGQLKCHPPFFYFYLGCHLGWKWGSPDTILEGGHRRTIPPKFGSNWPCGFRSWLKCEKLFPNKVIQMQRVFSI